MHRDYQIEDTEPEQSSFVLPSEKEHLLQVTDVNSAQEPSGANDEIQIVHLEVVDGEEAGRTLLNRCNLNENEKAFYFVRMFLKAIGEPYRGKFDVETDRWIGRQFYATVKHTENKGKTYANIDAYNFDKPVEQYKPPVGEIKNPDGVVNPEDIAWEN